MSGSGARLTRRVLGLVPDEPDQVLRLRDFRAAHPDAIIGPGRSGTSHPGFPRRTARPSLPGTRCASCSTSSTSCSAADQRAGIRRRHWWHGQPVTIIAGYLDEDDEPEDDEDQADHEAGAAAYRALVWTAPAWCYPLDPA